MGSVAERVRHAAVGTAPVAAAELAPRVADVRCGAVVTFDGVVRDHDEGRDVVALSYEAHPEAGRVAREVAEEIAERYQDVLIAVEHRVGPLRVGEVALAVAVASGHRKLAIAALDDLIDTVKRRLPIWKHQEFGDGSQEWLGSL
ncbi:molybdenum cofactor biosynthesis protein MoaE [Brachybacterium sp. EF45031]|nr:molybdenum cofactor biosynthesis protein MoaE [Brachybacterium sillae]